MFKKLNDIRVLYDGNLYAVDSIACDDGKAYEVPKYSIDFRPTRLNRRGAYNDETRIVCNAPQIKKVIFSGPALIVLWTDNTKTIVKADNEVFDPEKGIAMAFTKKVLGNKGNYFNVIRKAMNNAEVTPPKKKKAKKEKVEENEPVEVIEEKEN